MTLIIAMIVAALLLALGEILLPGGILGVLAFITICLATWLAVEEYGVFTGSMVFVGSVTLTLAWVFVFFKLMKRTKMSQRVFLNDRVEGRSPGANPQDLPEEIIGKEAETLTPMVPTGMVELDGDSYEAFSQSGFLEKGEPCIVIGKDNFRLIVRSLK